MSVTKAQTVLIVPVGDDLGSLDVVLNEFTPGMLYLLSPLSRMEEAAKLQKKLISRNVPSSIIDIKGDLWMDFFARVAELKDAHHGAEIIVVTSTGDKMSSCAMTSAAFVNGLKAVSVDGGKTMLLPVMKFSYYKLLSDRKMQLLEILDTPGSHFTADELKKRSRMSLPLVSYHLNGNLKSEGLVQLGLAEVIKSKGRSRISITLLGKMLLRGYVKKFDDS